MQNVLKPDVLVFLSTAVLTVKITMSYQDKHVSARGLRRGHPGDVQSKETGGFSLSNPNMYNFGFCRVS